MKGRTWIGYAIMTLIAIACMITEIHCAEKKEAAAAPVVKKAVNAKEKVFNVRELQGTDSDCADIEAISKGKFNRLLPGYVPGPFGPGVENKVITISREFLTGGLRASALATPEGEDTMDRQQMFRIRPFGANIEDSLGYDKKGEATFYRPYFSVLTKTGSIITGRSIYTLNPAEIDLIVRITPGVKNGAKSGHKIAWIRLID